MSYYLQIVAVQTPFDFGVDKLTRMQYSCNYDVERYGSNSLLEKDILNLIVTAGIVPTANISLGTKRVLPAPTSAASSNPSLDGPWVRLIATGGYGSDIDRSGNRAEKPSIQIIVATLDTELAATTAWRIYRLLDGKRHVITT